MMQCKDNDWELRVREVFRKAEVKGIEPSPYLQTRVLARIFEERSMARTRLFQRIAILGPMVAATAVFLLMLWWPSTYQAVVGQHTVVRVEVMKKSEMKIAYAEIELPQGVTFCSQKYPMLSERRELMLAFNESVETEQIPVVVQAHASGTKVIRLRFLDEEFKIIQSQQVRIRFS